MKLLLPGWQNRWFGEGALASLLRELSGQRQHLNINKPQSAIKMVGFGQKLQKRFTRKSTAGKKKRDQNWTFRNRSRPSLRFLLLYPTQTMLCQTIPTLKALVGPTWGKDRCPGVERWGEILLGNPRQGEPQSRGGALDPRQLPRGRP